jgi:hypothetical protein
MMRLLRIVAAVLLTAAGSLAIASPAQAGGWATTLLDPLPERLEPGRAYTVGYWVLQHGSHPYDGDLGKTALRLTDDAGKSTIYPGTALPEAAHYAAAIVFGHPGTWHLSSVQGIFADYQIGDATVPGGLTIRPTPTPMVMNHGDADHWGAIRPPLPADLMPAGPAASPTPATAAATQPTHGRWNPGPLVAGVALGAVGLTLLLTRRLRSRTPNHHVPGPRSSSL